MDWKQLLYSSLSTDLVLGPLRDLTAPSKITLLAYHELLEDDVDVEAWTVVRKGEFLRQLDYLDRYYEIVSLDQALARRDAPSGSRPLAVITFDDGDSGNATVLLPLVEKLQIPVTVYIATRQIADQTPYWFDQVINAVQVDDTIEVDLRRFSLDVYRFNATRGAKNWSEIERLLEALKSLPPDARVDAVGTALAQLPSGDAPKRGQIRPMTMADVKALAACPLITIGSHSHCHNLLTQIPAAAAEASVRKSKELLETWTGKPVQHFAYPNGSHDDSIVKIVQRAGFRSAVTFDAGLWSRETSPYRIPRMSVGRYDSLEKFKLNLVGGLRRFWQRAA